MHGVIIFMKTYQIQELEKNIEKLKSGKGIVRIESSMPNEYIGKIIRKKLEQAEGAIITVTYDVITNEMQQAAQDFT